MQRANENPTWSFHNQWFDLNWDADDLGGSLLPGDATQSYHHAVTSFYRTEKCIWGHHWNSMPASSFDIPWQHSSRVRHVPCNGISLRWEAQASSFRRVEWMGRVSKTSDYGCSWEQWRHQKQTVRCSLNAWKEPSNVYILLAGRRQSLLWPAFFEIMRFIDRGVKSLACRWWVVDGKWMRIWYLETMCAMPSFSSAEFLFRDEFIEWFRSCLTFLVDHYSN